MQRFFLLAFQRLRFIRPGRQVQSQIKTEILWEFLDIFVLFHYMEASLKSHPSVNQNWDEDYRKLLDSLVEKTCKLQPVKLVQPIIRDFKRGQWVGSYSCQSVSQEEGRRSITDMSFQPRNKNNSYHKACSLLPPAIQGSPSTHS